MASSTATLTTMAYWYNVTTKSVETDANRSRDADVLGPYATREAAEAAIETAHKRTEEQDAEDRRWRGDDD